MPPKTLRKRKVAEMSESEHEDEIAESESSDGDSGNDRSPLVSDNSDSEDDMENGDNESVDGEEQEDDQEVVRKRDGKQRPLVLASKWIKSKAKKQSELGLFLHEAQSTLRHQLSDLFVPPVLVELDEQYTMLKAQLKNNLVQGGTDSALLIGPRGSGKSALLNRVLEDLSEELSKQSFTVVELNGLVQPDDLSALRAVSRRLALESELEEAQATSFGACMEYLLRMLESGKKNHPILFVLDEFDIFATQKQAFLYNLLDRMHVPTARFFVVGLTARLDAVDLLEKRVKSRFAHRQFLVMPPTELKHVTQILLHAMTLPDTSKPTKLVKKFNTEVKALLAKPSVQRVLLRQFDLSRDIRSFFSLALEAVMRLTESSPSINETWFEDAMIKACHDPKLQILTGLSVLELSLVIALRKLDLGSEGEGSNFEMIFEEHKKYLMQTSGLAHMYSKPVSLKAFERLLALEIVRFSEANSKIPLHFRRVRLTLHSSQIRDGILAFRDLPTAIKSWGMQYLQ